MIFSHFFSGFFLTALNIKVSCRQLLKMLENYFFTWRELFTIIISRKDCFHIKSTLLVRQQVNMKPFLSSYNISSHFVSSLSNMFMTGGEYSWAPCECLWAISLFPYVSRVRLLSNARDINTTLSVTCVNGWNQ